VYIENNEDWDAGSPFQEKVVRDRNIFDLASACLKIPTPSLVQGTPDEGGSRAHGINDVDD
jgi:hypothetical protein